MKELEQASAHFKKVNEIYFLSEAKIYQQRAVFWLDDAVFSLNDFKAAMLNLSCSIDCLINYLESKNK